MNGLHPCTLPQQAPFAIVSRVSPLCAAFRAGCECARRSAAKPHVAPTCGQREKAQAQSAEKPRRGGENPPSKGGPASHLASRRRTGSLPNAKYRAEARAHFYERRKDEKRQTIQHPNSSTRSGNDTPESSTSPYEPERLCDRLLSRKTHCDSGRTEGSPAAAKSHRQQSQPAGCAGEYGQGTVRQSGHSSTGIRKNQRHPAADTGRRARKSQSSIS